MIHNHRAGSRRELGNAKFIPLAMLALATASCGVTSHAWVAGPTASMLDYQSTRGHCTEATKGRQAAQTAFTRCMEASGFRVAGKHYADQQSPQPWVARAPVHLLTPQYAASWMAPEAAEAPAPAIETAAPAPLPRQDPRGPTLVPPVTAHNDVTYRWGASSSD